MTSFGQVLKFSYEYPLFTFQRTFSSVCCCLFPQGEQIRYFFLQFFSLTLYNFRNDCMVCNVLMNIDRKGGSSLFEGGKR